MTQNGKAVVRIEYDLGEKNKVCYGEVEKKKIESFETGSDDFICIENDGNITWLDKESIISIESMATPTKTQEYVLKSFFEI